MALPGQPPSGRGLPAPDPEKEGRRRKVPAKGSGEEVPAKESGKEVPAEGSGNRRLEQKPGDDLG